MKREIGLLFLLLYFVVSNSACEKKGQHQEQTVDRQTTTSKKDFQKEEVLPLNAQLTNKAWEAFNNGDYERAVSYAEKCINEFLGGAERKQLQLEKENAALPPITTGQT